MSHGATFLLTGNFTATLFEVALWRHKIQSFSTILFSGFQGREIYRAETIEKTVRAIPADERRGVTKPKQWRPLIEKYR